MDVDVRDCYPPCAVYDHIAFIGWLLEVKFGVMCWSEVGGASVCTGWDVDCGGVCF